jgi:DNA-binding XRE family transcriptional regulator
MERMLVKLKGKRVERGLTQEEIARQLDMAISTYNQKENGKVEFSMTECIEIMKILQCTFEDIFLQ